MVFIHQINGEEKLGQDLTYHFALYFPTQRVSVR